MKRPLTLLHLFLFFGILGLLQAQGFPANPTTWPLTFGGFRDDGIHFGYTAILDTARSIDDMNSETWSVLDMNGDALPDLVVPGSTNSVFQYVFGFSPPSFPYWKVYYNNGNGFAVSSSTWLLPVGGTREDGLHLGHFSLNKSAYDGDDHGSESWDLVDINGDLRPDLVVTAETDTATGQVSGYSPGNNPYWRVYFNIGNSFASSAVNWPVPVGGYRDGGFHLGFRNTAGEARDNHDNGSQNWSLKDMDGDSLVDLVVTAQTDAVAGEVLGYDASTNPYWRVFFNNGAGFDTTATIWPLPVGGHRQGGFHYGYTGFSGVAVTYDDIGSETWNLADIDGDGLSDLVVCAATDGTARVMGYSPGSNAYWRVFYNTGTGFATNASNWFLPVGGKRQGGIHYGYVNLAGTALATDDNGSETWGFKDLHANDLRPDLVITAETDAAAGRVISYDPSNNPQWRVYCNLGTTFCGLAVNWNLPVGGTRDNNFHNGYIDLNGTALSTDDSTSQSWGVLDMSGDGLPDLVVTAETNPASQVMSYLPGSNPYWKVYVASSIVGTAQPAASALRLSPNPASSALRIDFPEVDLGSSYAVISLSGQTLRHGQVDGPVTTLDIQDLPAGMYFVRVLDGQGHTGKFVKQ